MADIVVTAASVLPSANAIIKTGIVAAATTVTAGQTLYLTTSNTLGLADSDATSPAGVVAGIALCGGGAGQRINYCTEDPSFTFGGTCTVATGAIYQSDTAGGITQTIADLESGDILTFLGIPLTTTTMNFKPTQGGTI